MNITGDLYLQVYNNQSGRFLEIPRNQASISFKVLPTGLEALPHTIGFSGFSFSGPISTSRIDMLPINIGGMSISGSGNYHLNLGLFSTHSFSKLSLVTGNAIGSHNIGYFDSAFDSVNSYNLGAINSLINSDQSFNIGINNVNSGSLFSYNLGSSNLLQSGWNSYLIGRNNTISSGNELLSFGQDNRFTNIFNATNIGKNNIIINSEDLISFGNSNTSEQSTISTIIGKNNSLLNSSNSHAFGQSNNLVSSANERVIGDSNFLNSGSTNLLVGNFNYISNTGNSVFGQSNTIDGSFGTIYGNSNILQSNALQDLIFGNTNRLSGTTSNTIIGFNNSSDPSLYIPFVSGILITGTYGETKLDRIYLTGANATGFFKYIADAVVEDNLYTGFTFNGLYTTTDFITYSKNLGMGLTNNIFGRINYDSQNLYGNGNAWILTLDLSEDVGGTYAAYTSYNLTGWSGLANVLGTTNVFTPNPTGRLSGYVNDNVNGFYNRGNNISNITFNNSKGHAINYDFGTGWNLYYNNVRTGDLPTTFERIYSEIDGTNFTGWSGLKSYNSGSAKIATGITYANQFNAIGGNSNFYIGNNNAGTLNSFSYSFGNGNSLYGNSNSYAVGRSNILENSISSYTFGELNTVSGFQNYVIGNNNEIRSGDFNSIFIGINYTPTGSDKVATISLASVDNKIEISPSEIRLDSANRPKINGENIIIQSDFNTISNSIVQNGPTFPTNSFKDPNYDKLADRISVSGFTYNSGAGTNLVSYPQEFYATSTLLLNNFNIFSTTSYTGVSGFNIIYGNHTRSQFSPAWIVVDNSTSGVYYKNDTIPFNITPQSGWYTTGFDGNAGLSANFGVNLVMGSRQGYMSVRSASFGTFYLPYFY